MLEALERLSGELNDAAHDPKGWTRALDTINSFVDGSGAVLLSVNERLRHAPTSSDLSEMMEDYFSNGWHARDRREDCRSLLLQKGLALDYEFQEPSQIEDCAFYADFLAKHHRKWFAGIGANLDGELWCLALQRSPEKGPFLSSDLPRLRAVRERLVAAVKTCQAASRLWLEGAFDAFALEGTAAAVLDRGGRVLQMTSAANALLARYVDRAGLLQFPDPRCSSALQGMLRSNAGGISAPGVLGRLPIELGQATYVLDVHRLLNKPECAFAKASYLLRVHAQKRDPAAILKASYRLTGTETRVATALASGSGIEEIAAAMNVSRETIRMHLKSIYAKTSTGTQAKLVAFIFGL